MHLSVHVVHIAEPSSMTTMQPFQQTEMERSHMESNGKNREDAVRRISFFMHKVVYYNCLIIL
jgi:hypothetical protein